MLTLFKQLKQSKSARMGKEMLEMLKSPERTKQVLDREEQVLAHLKAKVEANKPSYEVKGVYLEGKDVLPPHYQTEAWLVERGFKPGKKPVAILKTQNCQTIPLYDIQTAFKKIPGAELSFKGKVYTKPEMIPYKYQPLEYFARHQLKPKTYPSVKLFANQQFYIDYYEIPNRLNESQRSELLKTYPLTFEGDIYVCKWSEIPNTLKTTKQLVQGGLKVPETPTAYLFMGGRYTALYALEESVTQTESVGSVDVPMKKSTPQEVTNVMPLTFEETPLKKGEWLTHPDQYVLLDTETTGLKSTDEIIQLAVVNLKGDILYQKYFKPSIASSPEAYKVHKISDQFLKTQPRWQDCWPEIESLLKDKTILIQNASFDMKMLKQTCAKYQLSSGHTFRVKDTMKYFNQQFQVKSLKKVMLKLQIEHDDQKLHDAVEDCLKCVEVLNKSIAN